MKQPRLQLIVALLLAVVLAGCVGVASPANTPTASGLATATAPAVVALEPTPSQAPAQPNPAPAKSPTTSPSATPLPTATVRPLAEDAIKTVIQNANAAQQEAFASDNPILMQGTAIEDYYRELVAINQSLKRGGASAIELLQIEWGEIELTGADTARAVTVETWRTILKDGTTEQSRDLNVYTLARTNGEWKIQSDEHPGGNYEIPGSPATEPTNPTQPVPPLAGDGEGDTSRNWSGYVATGGTFTGVSGTWTVPESSHLGEAGSSAAWVGIGGVTGRDLIQAGTLQMNDGDGSVQYNAWIEMLPASVETVPLVVRPGDSVTVSISQLETDKWRFDLRNNTTGEDYVRTVRYQSSRSSAEWVQEAPSVGRRIVSLDDFGTVTFSAGTTVKDGESLTIAEAGGEPVKMADTRGNVLAAPSDLNADGDGFTVNRSNAAPIQPAIPNRRALPIAPVP